MIFEVWDNLICNRNAFLDKFIDKFGDLREEATESRLATLCAAARTFMVLNNTELAGKQIKACKTMGALTGERHFLDIKLTGRKEWKDLNSNKDWNTKCRDYITCLKKVQGKYEDNLSLKNEANEFCAEIWIELSKQLEKTPDARTLILFWLFEL